MSTKSELPDESWSEEKILELLKHYAVGSTGKHHDLRLLYLDELRRRTIKRVDEVSEILLQMMKEHGMSTPESSLIVELFSKLVNSEETAFKRLLDGMISIQSPQLYCFAKIVRNLDDINKKMISAKRLLSLLMCCDSFTNVTGEMYQTLVEMDNEQINKDIVEATLPYLEVVDPFKVVYAVRIISSLASADLIPKLKPTMMRALDGWYGAWKDDILTNICSYFKRIKDERTIPYLLQILRSDFNREAVTSKALASVIDAHPKAITEIWGFLEKEKEHYLPILMALEEMKTSIDVERLLSLIEINWGQWAPKESLKNIMTKAGKQAKPSLFKMVKDKNEVIYTFALECLEEIGVSIEEYSKVFEKPPILQVYEFFHGQREDMLLENLWKKQDKLGNPIKNAQMDRFEYFIHQFFSTLGFVTMFVDPSGKKGVDLVAFSPNMPLILIIGCTTGVIKEDLQRLVITLSEMYEALEKLCERFRILPMVITSKKVIVTDEDSKYAGKSEIAILTHEEIITLLRMLRTNRTSEEIIKQIEFSIPILDSDNPFDR